MNSLLTDIDALGSLTSIGGIKYLVNDALPDVGSWEALQHIGGDLHIATIFLLKQ